MIYGAGYVGLHVCDLMVEAGKRPMRLLDRSESLRGKCWRNIEIVTPDDVTDRDIETIICHSDNKVCEDIKASLIDAGYTNPVSIYTYADRQENHEIFRNQRLILYADDTLINRNMESISEVMKRLSDDISRETYSQIISALRNKSFSDITSYHISQQYFPKDLIDRSDHEVMVDIGGGPDGEVLEGFLERYGSAFDHYYLFDACAYVESLRSRQTDKISIEHMAVSDHEGDIRIRNYMGKNALVLDDGEGIIKSTVLDDYVENKKITILKADVEGMEMNVLRGARKTIMRDRPVIEMAIYHYLNEFWELPLDLMDHLRDYHFFIRSYQGVSETILYAVPDERLKYKGKAA